MGKVMNNVKELIIFGASKLGKMAFFNLKNQYKIKYFCDNDEKKWGNYIDGVKIISPTEVEDSSCCYIVIASMYFREITKQLTVDLKINENHIYIYDIDENKLRNLKPKDSINLPKSNDLKNIAFFCVNKGDAFLDHIVNSLKENYNVKKILVDEDYSLMDKAMIWADICWFEWCDELIVYASKLEIAKNKKIICRLHSYEAFGSTIYNVNWNNVDKVIFVAEHVRDNVLSKVSISEEKINIIYNGIDLKKFAFKPRKKGFNIAYVGYINFKKGPMLLLHTIKAIVDRDSRYKFYIAGKFNDERYIVYFNQMLKELGIENNVIYSGWRNDINVWLEDKNYIISSSLWEGNPVGVMEAMAEGIKPLIHNFFGAKKQFGKYVWSSIDECIEKLQTDDYDSEEYRKFIVDNYSLEKEMKSINSLINDIK